jgi:hypothetical protein
MLDGVLRDDGFARGRAGSRGFACVGTIGKNLRFCSHKPALRNRKWIDDRLLTIYYLSRGVASIVA